MPVHFPFKNVQLLSISLCYVQVSDAYVNVLCIVVFFSLNFNFFNMFLFLKNFCSIKYVLLAFFILSCKSIWCVPMHNLYFLWLGK